jgi:hypothetical protein
VPEAVPDEDDAPAALWAALAGGVVVASVGAGAWARRGRERDG